MNKNEYKLLLVHQWVNIYYYVLKNYVTLRYIYETAIKNNIVEKRYIFYMVALNVLKINSFRKLQKGKFNR